MAIAIDNIDMQLSEISGLVQAMLFMQEEADDARRAELRDATVAMLYIISDKLKSANGSVAAASRRDEAALH